MFKHKSNLYLMSFQIHCLIKLSIKMFSIITHFQYKFHLLHPNINLLNYKNNNFKKKY